MRGLEMNDSVCLQRQVGVQHGPSHSITVVLPLLRGVSGWLFSPKSFGLCKLSFWALVNALNLLCIGLDGFSVLDWIDLPYSQAAFIQDSTYFLLLIKKVQKGVGS